MTKTTEIAVIEDAEKPTPPNLFSFLPKFNIRLPLLPPKPELQDKANTPNLQQEGPKPNVVRFPKTQVVVPPPLEAEPDADHSTTKTSNPLILWQVYALGGIIISRWIWAKWNERKGQGSSPNDEGAEGRHSDDGRRSSGNE